jgi:predicted DNA-binding transcriptional regulator AlpA
MLLKDTEVGTQLGKARSTTWDCVREGTLPPPIRRGSKWSRWPSEEIDRIERVIVAGASDDELRALVKELIEARTAGRDAA